MAKARGMHLTNPMEWAMYLLRLGFVLTMRVSASARRRTARSSVYQLGNCGKRSAARHDRVLDPLVIDNSRRGLTVGNLKCARNRKVKGKGKGKRKSDAAPSKEGEGKADVQALPGVVRRQLSRPRWCSDVLRCCCT